ncbi:hypothetical protein KC19_12G163600 [Ceratodon purpureus]|uniref:Uncharacterized protein n=1 Tax=Ceratodon purpureus TaxID=3225 RepID=A0A8T0GA60_CERPU|nr:hypothetical protein KC19_12G163600 [Ceratodon purpureus]
MLWTSGLLFLNHQFEENPFTVSHKFAASESIIQVTDASNLGGDPVCSLGGNPYCSDPQADLLLQVCRSNPFQVLTKRTFFKKNHNVTIIITVVAAAIIVLLASIVSLVIIQRLFKRIRVLRDIQRGTSCCVDMYELNMRRNIFRLRGFVLVLPS